MRDRLGTTVVFGMLTLLMASAGFAAPQVIETFGERATGHFDAAAKAEKEAFMHRWLTASQVSAGLKSGIAIQLSEEELLRLETPRPGERRLEVGLTKPAAANFSGLDFDRGAARKSDEGFVWSAAASSKGATALRIHFEDLFLPPGIELYLYSPDGQVVGPYTGKGPLGTGEFWSHTVMGSRAIVQLHQRTKDADLASARFSISEIGHIGPKFLLGVLNNGPVAGGKAFCSFNVPCIENASCSNIPAAIQDAQDASAIILYASGQSLFICSGGLLTDTDNTTQTPHFLTANHCLSSNNVASTVEAFFQFTTPCGGACFDFRNGTVPSTLGSTIQATSSATDFNLLLLSQPAPAGSFFLGWTTSPVAFTNGESLFRISHPAGAPQAYSTQDVDTTAGTCGTLPRGNFIYSRDTFGGTEGGSSGSPVLNASGQVVGQLFGACGFNVNDACDVASNATVDGAFAVTFPSIQQFLDPQGGCTDNDGDGFCTDTDCDDGDASVNPGANEICGDGIDNNCDGTIDEGCNVCLPRGASCSANDECCSDKCRGRRGRRSCR